MNENLQKNWWLITLNGVIALLFGGLAIFATPDLMKTISTFIGLLVLVGGLLLLLGAYDLKRKQHDYALMLAEGLIASVVGIVIMIFPFTTIKIFLIFIGIWAIIIGLTQIYLAIAMRKVLMNNWVLIIGGLLLTGIGFLLLLKGEELAGVFMQIVGGVVVVVGMLLIYYSIIIKQAEKDTKHSIKS